MKFTQNLTHSILIRHHSLLINIISIADRVNFVNSIIHMACHAYIVKYFLIIYNG